jgi:hypothetical protein
MQQNKSQQNDQSGEQQDNTEQEKPEKNNNEQNKNNPQKDNSQENKNNTEQNKNNSGDDKNSTQQKDENDTQNKNGQQNNQNENQNGEQPQSEQDSSQSGKGEQSQNGQNGNSENGQANNGIKQTNNENIGQINNGNVRPNNSENEQNNSENGEQSDDHSGWLKSMQKLENEKDNSRNPEQKQNQNQGGQQNTQQDSPEQNQNNQNKKNSSDDKNSTQQNDENDTQNKNGQQNNQNEDQNGEQPQSEQNEREIFEKNRKARTAIAQNNFMGLLSNVFGSPKLKQNFGKVDDEEEVVDWKLVLRRELEKTEDVWTQRRSIAENNYAYRLEEYDVEDESSTEVMIDTSSSIDDRLLRSFLNQLKPLLKHSKLFVACFDSSFYGFKELKTDNDIAKYEIVGRGGTNFNNMAKHFSNDPKTNKIVFTDGYDDFSLTDKKYANILWIVFENTSFVPSMGKTIFVDRDKILHKNLQNERFYSDEEEQEPSM